MIENASQKSVRQSNFELMRILSMFMIVLWHVIIHSGLLNRTTGNLNLLLEFIFMFTAIHVNSFVLVSGYFQYDKQIKLKKISSLVTATWFYKAIYALIFLGFGIVSMSVFDLILFLLPLNYSYTFGEFYWFINIYIVLYLLIPYLNVLIKNLTQSQHRQLLIISFIFLSIIPFFTIQQVVKNNGYQVISFIMLYLIGAYFGKYKIKDNVHFKNYSIHKRRMIYLFGLFTIALLDFFMLCTHRFFLDTNNVFFSYLINVIANGKTLFSSPIIIVESILYLLLFETFNFKSKFINKISSLMFGVYLVHENLFVYNFIYKYLPLGAPGGSSLYGGRVIIKLFIITGVIFILSAIIEYTRQLLFNFINKRSFTKKVRNKMKSYIENF